jgi:CheY-like chemotaxis protein
MRPEMLDILLIDSDPNDAFFVQEALRTCAEGHHTFHAVSDAGDAIRYLSGQGPYADRAAFPLPNLILTDLKLPGKSGFEFLEWLRAHPAYFAIPALVYSDSTHEADIHSAYGLGANAYLEKPFAPGDLTNLLAATCKFWSLCRRPSPPNTLG